MNADRDPQAPTALAQDNATMVRKLLVVALAMFAFGWALVPLYRKICEVTGINVVTTRDADAAFADRARDYVVRLQGGDAENLAIWREMIVLSQHQFDTIYGRLGVMFDFTLGESFYNPRLKAVVQDLVAKGIDRLRQWGGPERPAWAWIEANQFGKGGEGRFAPLSPGHHPARQIPERVPDAGGPPALAPHPGAPAWPRHGAARTVVTRRTCRLPWHRHADERADAHQEHQRRHHRREHGVEVRRADRDLAQAERVQQGDFAHRIRIDSGDQLGELAASFNRMSGSIEHLLHVQREKHLAQIEAVCRGEASSGASGLLATGDAIYGVNTGFGLLAKKRIPDAEATPGVFDLGYGSQVHP